MARAACGSLRCELAPSDNGFFASLRSTGYHFGRMRHMALVLGVALLLWPRPAAGRHCAIDQVPAATLLLPYFEVDLSSVSAPTTVLFVTNTSPAAVLTHVTIWTDWGIPAFGFDVYFTGYDVQSLNLYDLVANGLVPRTASAGQDPTNTISPRGPRSTDVNYASCNGILPPTNPLAPAVIADLQAKLKGEPIPSTPTLCAGSPRGNSIARGYVTIDTVTGCTQLNPSSAGYFSGVAAATNVLTGEMIVVSTGGNTLWGYPLVHLEAAALPPGSRSFYGRYVGDSGADGREPLPSSFAARFLGPAQSTRLLVWRETPAMSAPVSCATGPSWVPLSTAPVTLLDETTQTAAAAAALPVAVGALDPDADLANPFDRGLAVLDLNHLGMGGRPAQAFVLGASTVNALEVSLEATELDDACSGRRYLLLRDGFEHGFTPWSGVQ